jgi:translation initiation factor 2B subunit (eIF-2B alpha/beta/delta family)
VNKIGTKGISELAKLNHVPHYVFGSSHKFDPLTYYGQKEMIEQRNPAEIWNKKLKHIKISNPAFDITPAENVKGIVCEFGVLSPQKFAKLMEKKLRLKSKKAADFDLKKLLK